MLLCGLFGGDEWQLPRQLLDGKLCVVTVTGYDRVLLWFALFVLHAERVAFVVDQEDFDLAVGSVVLVVGGAVGEDVLITDGVVDRAEDVGKFTLEDWGEAEAASHRRESPELVLGLQVVELARSATPAQFVEHGSGADGKNGDVLCSFDLGVDLVEGELGEGVSARTDKDDVLAPFDAAGAIEGLVEGVEEIGVGEAGDHQRLKGLADEVLIVGEVGENVGAEVIGDDGDVVVFAQRPEEGEGGVAHIVDQVVAVGGELKQHNGSNGRLGGADAGDGLGYTVFEDEEVVGLEARDKLVRFVEDDVGVDVDDGDVDAEGVRFVIRVLNLGGFGSHWSRRLVGLLFLLEDDVAAVCLGTGLVGWCRGGFLRRVLAGGGVLRVSARSSGEAERKG